MTCILDDSDGPLLASPQRHGTQQHKQSPLLRGSPQRKSADSGSLVWVRVTRSGELASSERGDGEGSYWWPACVRKYEILIFTQTLMCIQVTEGRSTTGPLTVSLYGEISPAAGRSVQLEAPSPSHILPFKWPGRDITRFSSVTFRCLETGSQRGSPSKRPKTALDEAWRSAVNLAHEADAYLNDGLPSNLSSYKVRTGRMHEKKAEASTSGLKTSSGWHLSTLTRQRPLLMQPIERWSPPPCDPLLEIPGELVFSLARKGGAEYWAARVEQYLAPKTPSMAPKYRVRFKDDTLRAVSRDMFYTSDEPKFYTCNVSSYSILLTGVH